MRVLLCSTYELGHQPLTLAWPAAFLLQEGYAVRCRDLAVADLDEQTVKWAEFVGISVPMHTAIRLGCRLAQEIKAINPNVHVCFYGLYASLNSKYLLASGGDSVVGGEFEYPLLNLIRNLGGQPDVPLEGIQLTDGPDIDPFLGRQKFYVPARDLLPPLAKYAKLDLGTSQKLVGYTEASRGCAHHCLHCPIPAVYGGRVRIAQEDVVLDDVAQLVRLGAEHIDFGDPDFLNGVKHSMRIARRMHEEFPDLTFNFTTKIEHIIEHEQLIYELAELGCLFIQSAVESFSDHILDHLVKGHTEADIGRAKEIADRAGIPIRPTLVAFTPWTAIDDYIHTMDGIEALGWINNLAPVQYAIRLLIPPGSCLLGKPQTEGLLGPLNEELFTYQWDHPDRKMDLLYEQVSELVRTAEHRQEDPVLSFYRIKSLALSFGRGNAQSVVVPVEQPAAPPPKLTEQWFC